MPQFGGSVCVPESSGDVARLNGTAQSERSIDWVTPSWPNLLACWMLVAGRAYLGAFAGTRGPSMVDDGTLEGARCPLGPGRNPTVGAVATAAQKPNDRRDT